MATTSENITYQQQLGQLLRNHRISQEWSLEDVSSQTRLDVLVLRHLEEGNLEAPPGKVFMRGFLRIYINSDVTIRLLAIRRSRLTYLRFV